MRESLRSSQRKPRRDDSSVMQAQKSTAGNVAMLASLGMDEAASAKEYRMSDALRARFERQRGYKMDSVRLVDSPLAKYLGANAFTQGNIIHFAPGAYKPHTRQGMQLLSHEMSHVVQQTTDAARGLDASLDSDLEAQASAEPSAAGEGLQPLPAISAASAPVQAEGGARGLMRKLTAAKDAVGGKLTAAKDAVGAAKDAAGVKLAALPGRIDRMVTPRGEPETLGTQLQGVPAGFVNMALEAKDAVGGKLTAAKNAVAGAVKGAVRTYVSDPHREAIDRLNAHRSEYDEASRLERFKYTMANPVARMRASSQQAASERRLTHFEMLDNLAVQYRAERKQAKHARLQAQAQGGAQPSGEAQEALDAPAPAEPVPAPAGPVFGPARGGPGEAWQRGAHALPARPQAGVPQSANQRLQSMRTQARAEALAKHEQLLPQTAGASSSFKGGIGALGVSGAGTLGLMSVPTSQIEMATTLADGTAGTIKVPRLDAIPAAHAMSALSAAGSFAGAGMDSMNAARHWERGNRSAAVSSGLSAAGQVLTGGGSLASGVGKAQTIMDGAPGLAELVPGIGIATGALQIARGAVDFHAGRKTQKAMETRLGSQLEAFKTDAAQDPQSGPVDFKGKYDKDTRHQIMMRNAAHRRKVGGAIDIAAGATKAVTKGAELGLMLSGVGAPVGKAIGMVGTAASTGLSFAKIGVTMAMAKKHNAETLKMGYNIDMERAEVRRMAAGHELSDRDVDYVIFKSHGIESGKEGDALNMYYLKQAQKLKAKAESEGEAGGPATGMLRDAGLSKPAAQTPLEEVAFVMGAPEKMDARAVIQSASTTRSQRTWKSRAETDAEPTVKERVAAGARGALTALRQNPFKRKTGAAAAAAAVPAAI